MSNLKEECGVFGIYGKDTQDVARTTYYGLFALQHRGQESAGIAINDDGVLSGYKDEGLVNDIFDKRVFKSIGKGQMALGHCRYGTLGDSGRVNAQPLIVNHHKGRMAIAHNGNIVNAYDLKKELELQGSIFHTSSDAEVISYLITRERINSGSIEEAINKTMDKIEGAYSLVVMSPKKLIAVRDPYGFRPLCYGKRDENYIVASESCALDAVGAEFVREIEPGEIVMFGENGVTSIMDHCETREHKICIFEYLYFARPDSVIEGKSVHRARVKSGALLALEYPVNADVVIGVPDSGLDAAIGYSEQSGIPYGMGFIKNKYIGRTFIAPGQKNREDKVRMKLNVIESTVRDKRVVLVDDSIVRGTTITRIIKLLKKAGAKEVHVMSAAPPFTDPCYYGTDVDSKDNLIACQYPMEEIAGVVGADSVGYLKLDHLGMIIGRDDQRGFCSSCFGTEYPTEVPSIHTSKFEQKLNKKAETKKKNDYERYIRD